MTATDTRRLVSVREIAAILGVPIRTVYDRLRKDGLPHYRFGRAIRLDLDELLAALRARGLE